MLELTERLTPLKQTSLYIHIPYCTKKCSYCDFYSRSINSKFEIEQVLKQILNDTEKILQDMGQPIIKTLFIGGGTPSAIPLDYLAKILHNLAKIITNAPMEYTVEVNPETVTKELLEILRINNVTRVSIGVQSLDRKILTILGRNTTVEKTFMALNIIKKYWHGSFSVDLINTVPEQTVNSSLSDIERINEFSPDHISLYSLTFEPSTKLYKMLEAGKITTLSETTDLRMQSESLGLLESLGYERYEISNFAKEGKFSLHNLNYWNMGTYLGVGPSAASTLMTTDGPVRITYKRSNFKFLNSLSFQNRIDFEYIRPESFLLEHLMMGFRLINGVNIEHINNIFQIDIQRILEPLLYKWSNVLILEKDIIYLNQEGLLLLNPFLIDVAALIEKTSFKIKNTEINWPILTAQF